MHSHRLLVLLAASAISLSAAPASAMRSHDAVVLLASVFQEAPVLQTYVPQIQFAQAQAPGRPLTPREQQTTTAPNPPARDPLVRVEPPSPQQPRNPFPPRPDTEPRLTNPLSR